MKIDVSKINRTDVKSLENNPGNYRWWAKYNDTKILLGDDFSSLKSVLKAEKLDNETIYLIYVGESMKLKNRINGYFKGRGSFADTVRSISNDQVSFESFYFEFQYDNSDKPGPTISKIESFDLFKYNIP